MPFVLFAVGALLVVSAVRGTQSQLFSLLKGDLSGSGSFVPWMISILAIGALGYINAIRPIVNAFLALVIVVLFLSNGGFFTKFTQQTGIGQTSLTGGLPSLPSLSMGSNT